MYPVQYLCNNTTTRVPSPGPTTKFVGTMAQDSVQKRGGGGKNRSYKKNKKRRIHIVSRSTYYYSQK